MSVVKIIAKPSDFFEFKLDGVTVMQNKRNDLTIIQPSGFCHFKTSNGANILKRQDILITEVTVVDLLDVETHPATAVALFQTLNDVGYFAWMGIAGTGGGSGVNKFRDLIDTFGYVGNNGKVPIVNESLLRLDAVTLYNYRLLTELEDVAISTLSAPMAGKVVGVALVGGLPKFVLTDPAGGSSGSAVAAAGAMVLVRKGYFDGNANTLAEPEAGDYFSLNDQNQIINLMMYLGDLNGGELANTANFDILSAFDVRTVPIA